jgi:hypothetical protein
VRFRRAFPLVTGPSSGGFVRARANALDGEAEKVRQRWIAWSVHRGPREIGCHTIACGTPGLFPAFAVTTSSALSTFRAGGRGRRNSPGVPAGPQSAFIRTPKGKRMCAIHLLSSSRKRGPIIPARKTLDHRGYGSRLALAYLIRKPGKAGFRSLGRDDEVRNAGRRDSDRAGVIFLLPPPCGEGSLPSEAKANGWGYSFTPPCSRRIRSASFPPHQGEGKRSAARVAQLTPLPSSASPQCARAKGASQIRSPFPSGDRSQP